MIDLFYTFFDTPLATDTWNSYLQNVPEEIQTQVMRFKRWQDRHSCLLGKILLREGLKKHGYPPDCLNNLSYSTYKRPFIDNSIDFNISHSGEYVMCAINTDGRVGIDIERKKPLNFAEFRNYMTPDEWDTMREAPDQSEYFYDLWTVKESVIKAEGKGLSIPLLDIHRVGDTANFNKNIWYIKKVAIDLNYSCHVVTNNITPEICVCKFMSNKEFLP